MEKFYRENKIYTLIREDEREVVLQEHREDGTTINWSVLPSVFRDRYESAEEGISAEFIAKYNMEFDFGMVISLLKQGHRVARKGWNGKGMWLELQRPTELSKMTLPYIFMKTADNNLVPWLASQTDMLAEDWVLLS